MENPWYDLNVTTASFIIYTLKTDKIPSSSKRGAESVLVGTDLIMRSTWFCDFSSETIFPLIYMMHGLKSMVCCHRSFGLLAPILHTYPGYSNCHSEICKAWNHLNLCGILYHSKTNPSLCDYFGNDSTMYPLNISAWFWLYFFYP